MLSEFCAVCSLRTADRGSATFLQSAASICSQEVLQEGIPKSRADIDIETFARHLGISSNTDTYNVSQNQCSNVHSSTANCFTITLATCI
ncbi:unnamed protein product [Cylicocyclus nassatus]|uniref:Uncharacterized protein n=1 Tax=Cylicocyclus nassatus TaxID=53992 RepID=A0AA36MHI4_CYLNA|nr:unnamed protein product [Cylicocyclus nassatus]